MTPSPHVLVGRGDRKVGSLMSDVQYFFANGNEQRGPHSAGELVSFGLRPDTLVWREGMPDWRPMADVPELVAMIETARVAPPATDPVDAAMPNAAPTSPS